MTRVDVVIVGGGAMGMGAALALARRGREVLVLEQFEIGNDLGSSHDHSRILRFAYFEHPEYGRMAARSRDMWRSIEQEANQTLENPRILVHPCGGLDIGPPDGRLVKGALSACKTLNLEHEILDRSALESRFPFRHDENDDVLGIYQPDACILAPTHGILAMEHLATHMGVEIREHTAVRSIEFDADSVSVLTDGETIVASHAIVTAGAWSGKLLSELDLPLVVQRKFVAFFEPEDVSPFELGRFPIFIYENGPAYYYGFPIFGRDGVKIGDHEGDDPADPDEIDRTCKPGDEAHLRAFLEHRLPSANGSMLDHRVCMYTMTPDGDFIVDRHPACERVSLAAGFSGHGFKFAPYIGEMLADLAQVGPGPGVIERSFSWQRRRFGVSRFG